MTTDQAFDKLSEIQARVGYKQGEINVVAILGLVGEGGEVINEWQKQFVNSPNYIVRQAKHTVAFLETIDDLKKKLRDKLVTLELPHKSSATSFDEQHFDFELADTLYYIHALMINRGKPIKYYAELMIEKLSDPKWKNTNVEHCVPKLIVDAVNGI